jgi:transcription termination factor Rho
LELDPKDATTRIMDLLTPIGKGQRGCDYHPHRPKSGKTIILQKIANSITANHPEVKLIVLLIDERRKKSPTWNAPSKPKSSRDNSMNRPTVT